MHDHSGKVKQLTKATDDIQQNAESTITTKATDDIQPNPYLGYINHTDITEDFLANIEAESACVNNVSEKLDTSLKISKSQSVAIIVGDIIHLEVLVNIEMIVLLSHKIT
jgi:hypothetical protein